MIYRSTRSEHRASAPEAVLQGIAPDGGLYVPESFPDFDWQGCLRCPPTEISARVLAALKRKEDGQAAALEALRLEVAQ